MSSDFMPSTPKIDEIVNAVRGPEGLTQMREAIKQELAGTNEQAAPAPRVALPANHSAPTDMRVFYVGNSRFEIYGTSQADLNEQESQIRALYSSRQ